MQIWAFTYRAFLTPVDIHTMEAIDNETLIYAGSMLIIYARMTFTSKKLMEVEVIVDSEVMTNTELETKRIVEGYFSFGAVTDKERFLPIPALKVRTYAIYTDTESSDQVYHKRVFGWDRLVVECWAHNGESLVSNLGNGRLPL